MAKTKAAPKPESEPAEVPDIGCDGFELIHGGRFVVPGYLEQLGDDCERKHAEAIRRACELRDATAAYRDRLASYPRDPREAVLFGVETRLRKLDLLELERDVHREVAEVCSFLGKRTCEALSEAMAATEDAREAIVAKMEELGAEGHFCRETARKNQIVVSLRNREARLRDFHGRYVSSGVKHHKAADWCDSQIETATREIAHGSTHEVIVSAGEAANLTRKYNSMEYHP